MNNSVWFKFVINGKVISLHKEIRNVKRSKISFVNFSAKHTQSATLRNLPVEYYYSMFIWSIALDQTKLHLQYSYILPACLQKDCLLK